MDRLDFNHMLMTKMIGGKLFLAPVEPEKVHDVLDIGTGTGICQFVPGKIWSFDFGLTFHRVY